MPNIRLPHHTPLTRPPHIPPKRRILRPRLPTNPPGLQLRKMALEEAYLMLAIHARRIRRTPFDAEMVPHQATVNSRSGLRDQLRAPHRLSVPVRRVVEREFRALRGAKVGGVLVAGREVDVGGYVGGAMDVVLVGSDFVAPGPIVEIGRRGEVVEAAVPEDGPGLDERECCCEGYECETHVGG